MTKHGTKVVIILNTIKDKGICLFSYINQRIGMNILWYKIIYQQWITA